MDPKDFFNRSNVFTTPEHAQPWSGMPERAHSLEQLQEIKNSLKEYRSVINEEFWGHVHGLTQKKITILPTELWESQQHIYLLIAAP
jgi:hypothetical protein